MWNDKETDLDLLGHSRMAQTIVSIMDEQELRPLTIGVYGSWGVGKSSVLSLIKSELDEDSSTLTIVFNGWLFQGYEDTRSALMETIISELVRLQPADQKVIKLAKSLFKRINWLKVAKIGGGLAFTAMTGMPDPSLWGLPGLLNKAKGIFGSKEEGQGESSEDSTDPDSFLKDVEETVPGQIHAFREELKELIKTSKVSRVVVLVDELDRCLPTAVIDILEAIRLFLFVEGTVFVIAADEQMIEYAVRRHFPDLPVSQAEYTKHYLEKLIQVPISVPSLNQLQVKNYIRFLLLQYQLQHDKGRLRDIYNAFDESIVNPYENMDVTYEFLCKQLGSKNQDLQNALIVAEQLGAALTDDLRGNPRNIKRFLNTIFLRLRVAKVYKIEDKVNLDALSKIMLLERFHSNDYEIVVSEVAGSVEGKSNFIKEIEGRNKDVAAEKQKEKVGGTDKDILERWSQLKPSLSDIDLRPYIFVSKDKVINFQETEDLPHALKPVFEALVNGAQIQMAKVEDEIKALSPKQAEFLFKLLSKEGQKISDWSKTPDPLKGIFYLVANKQALEENLIELLDTVSSKDMKIWAISHLAGFKTERGRSARKKLLDRLISSTDASKAVKNLAQQLYSK